MREREARKGETNEKKTMENGEIGKPSSFALDLSRAVLVHSIALYIPSFLLLLPLTIS